MTNQCIVMEGSGTLEKSPEFTRIFFAMQIEVSGN